MLFLWLWKLLHFVVYYHVWRAQFLVDVYAFCLVFFIMHAIGLLPYFLEWFCALLVWFLKPKPSLFNFFVVAGFPRRHCLVFHNYASADFVSFCAPGFGTYYSSNDNSFCGVGESFSYFFCSAWFLLFFACFVLSLNQLKFAGFARFFALLHIFVYFAFDMSIKKCHEPIFCHHSPQIIICDHHNHPCQLTVFFRRGHAFQNMSCSRICSSFCLVFRSPLAHVSHCTHPHT